MLTRFRKSFRYQINELDKTTKNLNEVFNSLEEFNRFFTNLILQLFSIILAIVAITFAFRQFYNHTL